MIFWQTLRNNKSLSAETRWQQNVRSQITYQCALTRKRSFDYCLYKNFPMSAFGFTFLAYTIIIYLWNKIKSGLYRIYSTYMLKTNSQQSGYLQNVRLRARGTAREVRVDSLSKVRCLVEKCLSLTQTTSVVDRHSTLSSSVLPRLPDRRIVLLWPILRRVSVGPTLSNQVKRALSNQVKRALYRCSNR